MPPLFHECVETLITSSFRLNLTGVTCHFLGVTIVIDSNIQKKSLHLKNLKIFIAIQN